MARIPQGRTPRRAAAQPSRAIADPQIAARGLQEAANIQSGAATNVSQLAQVGADVAETFLVEQQRVQYADARSRWSSGIIELNAKYAEDKEYDTLPSRYNVDLNALHEEISEGLPGNLRQSFQAVTSVDLARSSADIQKVARDRAHDAQRAHLVETLDTHRRAYLTSGTPTGRMNALEAATASIDLALAHGAIDEETAATQRQQFAAGTATDRILMMPPGEQIMTLLSDNALSLAMDPLDRAKVLRSAMDSIDEGPSEAFKESSGRLANLMLIGINQGRITSADIIAADQDLTREDQRVLIKALGDETTPDTDPLVFADLHSRALEGADITDAARLEYLNRRLSQADYLRLSQMAVDRPGPGSVYDRVSDALSDRLRPGAFEAKWDREGAEIRRANAMREFDDWFRENEGASESQYWAKADEIGQRWSQAGQSPTERRGVLPRPQFYSSIQDMSDLTANKRRILNFYINKHNGDQEAAMADPDFERQAEIILQWKDFLEAQDAR